MHSNFRRGNKDSLVGIERKRPSVKTERGLEAEDEESNFSADTPLSTVSSGADLLSRSNESISKYVYVINFLCSLCLKL